MRSFFITWIPALKGECKAALCLLTIVLSLLPLAVQGAFELYTDDDSSPCGRPAIAADGTNFLAVWAAGNDIFGARVTHAGVVLDTTPISISTAVGDAFCPSVAYDGSNYLVVWPGSATAGNADLEMYAARVNSAGAVLNTDIPVTTATTPLTGRPYSLAFDGTNYLVVWRAESQTVEGTRVTTAGASLDGNGFNISSIGNSKYPWVAFGGGSFLVGFMASATNGYGIYGVHVATDGTIVAPGTFSISDEVGDEAHASVVYGSGNFLVTWQNGGPNYLDISATNTVHAVRVESGTVLDVPALQITDRSRSQQPVATAFDGTDYIVAWMSELGEEQNQYRQTDIFARRVSTSGALVDTGPFPVEINAGHQFGPRIAYDGGALLIAWAESTSGRVPAGATATHILARILDSQATGIGVAPTVQAPVAGGWSPQLNPASTHLYDIWGADDSNVYAFSEANGVGIDADILRYDGNLWTVWVTPAASRIFSGWVSSANEVFFSGFCGAFSGLDPVLGWFGISPPEVPPGNTCPITTGHWGTGAYNIYGVTVGGRTYTYAYDPNAFSPVTRIEIPNGISTDLWDVGGNAPANLYAAGAYGAIYNYDGATWNQIAGVPTSHSLNAAWVSRTGEVFAVGDHGRIVHFDGNTWNLEDSGTDKHLFGVSGNSNSEVYAVGLDGTIVHFDGNNWQAEMSSTANDLFNIWVGSNSAWAVGEQGTILTRSVTAPPPIPAPVVGTAKTTVSATSFDNGSGEKVVFGFSLTSDSTDAEIREVTVSASGDLDESTVIGPARLYLDMNRNGIPEVAEQMGSHLSYSIDDGELTFTLPNPFQLSIGETHFLVTYAF